MTSATFRVRGHQDVPLQEEAKGSRVHLRATLGAKAFAVFHIDVVVGTAMTGEPGEVAPLTPLHVDGLVRPPYRAFPLPVHVADMFCTILGTYIRGETVTGSSRITDLVDIALIATTQQISGPRCRRRSWPARRTDTCSSQMRWR